MTKDDAKKYITLCSFVIVLLLIIATILTVFLWPRRKSITAERFTKAAVATDAEVCSKIGAGILKKNGSAIDAAVATIFCTGVANPQSSGIGGGGLLLYYERKTQKFKLYDFRSSAPSFATKNMFKDDPSKATYGGLSIAIPGQVKGMWKLHKDYGTKRWADLLEPSVKLAEKGIVISKSMYYGSILNGLRIGVSDALRNVITDPQGDSLQEGDIYKNPELIGTLKRIQKNPDSFYNGDLAKDVVNDINKEGGNVSLEDLQNYKVVERPVFTLPLLNGSSLYTTSSPGGGPIYAMIMNIMKGYNYTGVDFSNLDDQFTFYQRFVESLKFSYAQRGYFGDPDFVPEENITKVYRTILNETAAEYIRNYKINLNETHEPSYYGGSWANDDYGTSHVSIISGKGDAVSATLTINSLFGSLIRSGKTGIIYNNAMDDFSIPGVINSYDYQPSSANYIEPGKRPLSSLCPSIVLQKNGNVRLVIGAAGGSKIISGTAEVTLKKLFLGLGLGESVSSFRLHHQGLPNVITYYKWSYDNNDALFNRLREIGHVLKERPSSSIVQVIFQDETGVYAMTDPLKGSKPSGF